MKIRNRGYYLNTQWKNMSTRMSTATLRECSVHRENKGTGMLNMHVGPTRETYRTWDSRKRERFGYVLKTVRRERVQGAWGKPEIRHSNSGVYRCDRRPPAMTFVNSWRWLYGRSLFSLEHVKFQWNAKYLRKNQLIRCKVDGPWRRLRVDEIRNFRRLLG